MVSFTKPEDNLKELRLQDGMQVVDLGAGTGTYAKAAARMVAPGGTVVAVEVQRDLLDRLKQECEKNEIKNLEVIWANIEKKGGTKLRDGSMDRAILSNVLFQADDQLGVVREAARILKTDGLILFVDWSDSFSGMGDLSSRLISRAQARVLFEENGFIFEKDVEAGSHHYGILFRRKGV
jgi:ubiquinone/menaquinone biosynthesis C-methylase UbiE